VSDVSFLQYGLVALTAFAAATIGGITGYGGGLLLPLVLVPIVGAQAIVPIIGISALFTNTSRVLAFRSDVDRRLALPIILCSVPTCILGAYGFTLLTGPGAALLIGTMLVVLVPARRLLTHLKVRLQRPGVAAASGVYGVLVGGTTGAGIVLLSILMMAGLSGRAVIATDALVSIAVGIVKTASFQAFGALPLDSWIMALVIGAAGTPGAFVAKRLTENLSVKVHNAILEVAIVAGGLILIAQSLRA
jgi:uncharacterized membrane protein YfcA